MCLQEIYLFQMTEMCCITVLYYLLSVLSCPCHLGLRSTIKESLYLIVDPTFRKTGDVKPRFKRCTVSVYLNKKNIKKKSFTLIK